MCTYTIRTQRVMTLTGVYSGIRRIIIRLGARHLVHPAGREGPISESDFFTWEALIVGPKDTPFEGGVFPAILTFVRTSYVLRRSRPIAHDQRPLATQPSPGLHLFPP